MPKTLYATSSIKHDGAVVAEEGDAVDVSVFSAEQLAVLVEGGTLTEDIPFERMDELSRARALVKRLEAEKAEYEASKKTAARAEVESERVASQKSRGERGQG